ncbi:AAC(3) family N-acetyltransferase [Candidatus Woesearchaeota archaeon]|nr:AAC(3) family N-acetyltransferase [Candidatus Woesearchaeota archaeon]
MESKVRESAFRRKIKALIPFQIQKFLYNFIKKFRLAKNIAKNKYAKEDIKKFLTDAGIKKGDAVMLHSSLGRVGYVEGGADTIIEAFIEIIGEEGILIMPTFSAPEYDEKRKIYVFDVKKTPSYTGAIPETFRLRNGVKRSISPMHSVAAHGKKAGWLVQGHENCDNPYSMRGPFGKLYELNAKICQIGVDQLANSCIHIVEDKIKFPIKIFSDKIKAEIIDENGKKKIIWFRKHLDNLYKTRNNNILEKYLLEEKLMKIYPFGNTELRVHKVKDLVHLMEKLAKKGITIYNS